MNEIEKLDLLLKADLSEKDEEIEVKKLLSKNTNSLFEDKKLEKASNSWLLPLMQVGQ